MEIHPSRKWITLSVREFAEFQEVALRKPGSGAGTWRAAVGSSWHRKLEAETAEAIPRARFEIPIEMTWPYRDWSIRFQGRIDQLNPTGDSLEIIEVKSVEAPLPLPEDSIPERFPGYLNQLATYCVLAAQLEGVESRPIRGVLLLVDISSGLRQRIPLGEEAHSLFEKQLSRLYPFLQSRWTGFQRRSNLVIHPPFQQYRDGQRETLEATGRALNRGSCILLEAPTGFGKTGIALEECLNLLKAGSCDRLLYLTSKSTGQLQALRQLQQMIPWDENPPRYFQVRNRREHGDEPAFAEVLSPRDQLQRWRRSGLSPYNLLEEAPLHLDRIRTLAADAGLPPYEITRAALPFADIWIGDLNYVFGPDNRSLFENVPGFQPERSALIVDEAHNLPSRTAGALSTRESAAAVDALFDELTLRAAPRPIRSAVTHWFAFLEGLKPAAAHAATVQYEVRDHLDSLTRALNSHPLDWRDLSPETADHLYAFYTLRARLQREDLEMLYWSPDPGVLEITCLDAASEIRQQLDRFGHTLLMSATLRPFESFALSCGLAPGAVQVLEAPAPWRDSAYAVAIDSRVDTRWKERDSHFGRTAETIRLVAEAATGTVAVFFPSYRYADTIAQYLQASDPLLRIALQPRARSLQEQEDFLRQALLFDDVLFLILGTGFSEGIDSLGEAVNEAIVVGPALPEVNAVQRARMDRLREQDRDQAFRRVYQIPAMQKINQALGRLVRAPGQSARVLLHCRRFAQTDYQELLAPEYRGGPNLRDEDALLAWIRGPSPHSA